MIHVGTAEDVLASLAAGWRLWGRREAPPKRGYTYWLEPPSVHYAARQVSARIVTALQQHGQIAAASNAYGDLHYQLGSLQEELL